MWRHFVLCHFLATKMGQKRIKTSKIAIYLNFKDMNDQKTVLNRFFQMNSYSYVSWFYVIGFLVQNSKNSFWEVISGNLKKRITVRLWSPLKVAPPELVMI